MNHANKASLLLLLVTLIGHIRPLPSNIFENNF